ncbi:MAG: YXWGXW repeat-containing protein [Armatimonadetes bacterium]|nr:YXWGXW repeat-containing protein [Akkermansiaceae bacterium]
MNYKKHTISGCLAAIIIACPLLGSGNAMAQEDGEVGAEVQTRGPVHEAFAGTVTFDPEPGIIVDQEAPALIEEVPPEQRLEGDNVVWIPGYWGWDEDQSDFLWISGIWRNLPPGREWIPGYWSASEGRYQWTSGYWEDAETTEVAYLPKPPRSVEAGPNIRSTSNNQSWVPGNWIYRDDRYAWSPGSWVDSRENWTWTPAYYRWTRRGYVYVDGYWDYPVVRRGVVFAPVHFERNYISRPDFYYTPSTVISLSVFTNHLFLRPNYGHYYFGDYYESRYRDRGYYSSHSYNSGRRGYDPIYSHYRWENRDDRDWDRKRREYYEYRRDNRDSRPPRTWAALSARSEADRDRGDYGVADRFDRVISKRDKKDRQRFQAVDKRDRDRYVSQRQEIRKFGREREQLETNDQTSPPAADEKGRGKASRLKINRSPLADNRSDRSDKKDNPPARLRPRASDKDQQVGNLPEGNEGRPGRDKSNRKKDSKGDGEAGSLPNGNPEPAIERRNKPGQKRDREGRQDRKMKTEDNGNPDPAVDRNTKPEADPTDDRKGKSGKERQNNPPNERKLKREEQRNAKPDQNPEIMPEPDRKPKPSVNREASPKPERQDGPAQREISPERKAKPERNREPSPKLERQDRPTKREAAPQQERKAKPQQNREPSPKPERQDRPAKREAAPQQERNSQPEQRSEGNNNRQKKSKENRD